MLRSLEGTPWSAVYDLSSARTGDEVVVPRLYEGEPAPQAGDAFVQRQQVVIHGVAWSFRASAAGQGFTLIDSHPSLGDLDIWQVDAAAAGSFSGSQTPCYIPLQPTQADTPASDPATLKITVSAATSGHVWLWGTINEQPGTRTLYRSSPQWDFRSDT